MTVQTQTSVQESDLQILANIVILKPETAVFAKPEENGYLSLKFNDIEYTKIKLSRALPYKNPEMYICCFDKDGKEIGIIKNLADYGEEQQILIKSELSRLYYSPVILKITSAKEKMGYMYFEVQTTAGKRDFALKDASRNIKFIDPEIKRAVQILDVDGNRYLIEDFSKLDSSSAKKIEAYLV